ncbi:MAG: MATE family efflux transporter [Eubacteriaceae bacterium]
MIKDLTQGSPLKVIVSFSIPMILGNFFQLFYNIADSVIVGRFVGANALAAVGSSFTFMVFITSIVTGLCMGAGIVFSNFFGARKYEDLKSSISTSFVFISICSIIITLLSLVFIDEIIKLMNVPSEVVEQNRQYFKIIFYSIFFSFLYNWAAGLLRSLGNSKVPFYFLILSIILNIILDLIFIIYFKWGVKGAAWATDISIVFSSVLCLIYCIRKIEFLNFKFKEIKVNKQIFYQTVNYSVLTSVQQSIMNFGILMIQGLVNSFGAQVMAAFAIGVKIDTLAYMPMQELGNAFSTYVAQNKGAGKDLRIISGTKVTAAIIAAFTIIISIVVWIFSKNFIGLFISSNEMQVIATGVSYLRIEGSFYILIGFLFMFYGLFRGLGNVKISIALTIISLGTRVTLAYALAPIMGTTIIWASIVIGWVLADITGLVLYKRYKKYAIR